MVSKAMSGVKRPVLLIRERTSHGAKKGQDGGEKERKKERREEGWVERKVLIVKKYPASMSFFPPQHVSMVLFDKSASF